MIAMIEVTPDTAITLWNAGDIELYALHDDGSESLIENDEEFDYQYAEGKIGMEGELFGKPYEELKSA